MANTINFILTNSAVALIPKVLSGKTLNFTRMAVGDGFCYDTETAKGYTKLVKEVLSLDITKKETQSPSSVRITSVLKNTDAQKEFYYREVGLYAQDPDTGEEVLYAYGNRNDAAELITPAGSTIITKQLIFVIAVGDSANVTFNVNADVYALQEDMLDVQENIEQIQTNLEQAQGDITTLQSGKADNNLANTGMLTNCLLEVPNNIKYEFKNGVLTLKAGSVVIVPNGLEDDGITPRFDHKTIVSDITYNGLPFDGECFIFVNSDNKLDAVATSHCTSGATPLPSLWTWYDTTNNHIKQTQDYITWINTGFSFPIFSMSLQTSTPYFKSVNRVFNGMGHIGSTVFILPGVKGLIPNGRNANQTFKNIEYKTIKVHHASELGATSINRPLFIDKNNYIFRASKYFEQDTVPEIPITAQTVWYNPKENKHYWAWKNQSIKNWTEHELVNIGRVTIDDSSVITSLVQRHPFQVVDYNDYLNKIAELETRITALETI